MEYSGRGASMDVSLDIPAPAASMESMSMSEERIAVMSLPRRTAMPASSPNKIIPLGFQNETPRSLPDPSFARSVAFPLIKKVAAELLGTFLLIFIVLSALITNEANGGALGLLGVASTAGLALFVLVSSLGHVSGGHLNPAVSVAMAVFGHLPAAHLAPYVASQILGSTSASFAAKALYHPLNGNNDLASTIATVPTVGATEAFFIEFITTFTFLFAITALATDPKAVNQLVPVGVGAGVMMGALISGRSTGASMNPARTLGTAIATGTYTKIWVYMVAPPLGAIAGAGAYTVLK